MLEMVKAEGAGETRSMGELAEVAEVSSAAMTSTIDYLERKGFVRRVRTPGDRRVVNCGITAKGRRRAEEYNALVLALIGRPGEYVTALTAEEVKAMENGDEYQLDAKETIITTIHYDPDLA